MKKDKRAFQEVAYTNLSNEELAKKLLEHALLEEGDGTSACLYREGLANHQAGDRKVKITLTVENA